MISQSLAAQEWPSSDPLGRVILFGNMDGDLRPFTIVGIVGDIRERGLDAEARPMFYGSSRQRKVATMGVYSVIAYLVAQREHEIGIRVALLLGVALVASYVPARRALRVDPMDVLRNG